VKLVNPLATAYLLWFFGGLFGIHRFYCGRVGTGILWACTGGLCGVGWLVDLFLLPSMVRQASRGARLAGEHPYPGGYPQGQFGPVAGGPAMGPRPAPANRVIYCTQCGNPMQVPAGSAGLQYACPACRTVLEVPG
jgi:TM2 domain-containing membrane protein YozV